VRYHFVLVDYLCWPSAVSSRPVQTWPTPASLNPAELPGYNLTAKATEVIARALELDRQAPRPVR
jgi:hypothetical protein